MGFSPFNQVDRLLSVMDTATNLTGVKIEMALVAIFFVPHSLISHPTTKQGGRMALILVRPCVICGNPMETQRASKKTCSHRCYMHLYRTKQHKQTTNTREQDETQ